MRLLRVQEVDDGDRVPLLSPVEGAGVGRLAAGGGLDHGDAVGGDADGVGFQRGRRWPSRRGRWWCRRRRRRLEDARSTRGDRVTPTARALGAARPRAKTPRRWASAEVAGDVIANDDMATGGRATGVRSHTGGLEDARRDAERSAGGERSGGLRGSSAGGLPVRAESARPAHGRRRRARSPSHISESAGKCRTVIGRRGCNLEKRMGNSMRKTCGPPLARFLISDPSRSSWSQRCFADGVPL